MPFWLSFILALFGMIYFAFFIEAVCLLALSDLLYGVREVKFLHMIFISSVISIVILFVLEFLKKKIKFYPK